MALKEVYHVVASQFDVEPEHFGAVDSNDIIEGMPVQLDSSGFVKRGDATNPIIGLAGDSLTQSGGFTENSADIVISPSGDTRSTSNRVSDFFNETQSSGMMTVYMSGGEFLTDQYDSEVNWDAYNLGGAVWCTAAGLLTTTDAGYRVGFMVGRPAALESGVPGVDINGSITSGNFMRISLDINDT